jgi:hypothetical protein
MISPASLLCAEAALLGEGWLGECGVCWKQLSTAGDFVPSACNTEMGLPEATVTGEDATLLHFCFFGG